LPRVVVAVVGGHNVSIIRNIGVESCSTPGSRPELRGDPQG